MTDYTVTMSRTQDCPNAASVRWESGADMFGQPLKVGRWFPSLAEAMDWVEERKAADRGLDVGVA